jgi:hypothetical protein
MLLDRIFLQTVSEENSSNPLSNNLTDSLNSHVTFLNDLIKNVI